MHISVTNGAITLYKNICITSDLSFEDVCLLRERAFPGKKYKPGATCITIPPLPNKETGLWCTVHFRSGRIFKVTLSVPFDARRLPRPKDQQVQYLANQLNNDLIAAVNQAQPNGALPWGQVKFVWEERDATLSLRILYPEVS